MSTTPIRIRLAPNEAEMLGREARARGMPNATLARVILRMGVEALTRRREAAEKPTKRGGRA